MKVNELVQRYGPIVGRILLAAIFIVAGMNKLLNFGGTAAYMESAGLPMVEVLLVATIVIAP